jgi:hypothetical protein
VVCIDVWFPIATLFLETPPLIDEGALVGNSLHDIFGLKSAEFHGPSARPRPRIPSFG